MPDIAALNTRFGIADQVTFARGKGGLGIIEIRNSSATARIALQGAQLLHWAPAGAEPVIWLSEAAKFAAGKTIRGGIPVCWPWFGPHPGQTTSPAHGFARTGRWEVVAVDSALCGTTRLVFRLLPSEEDHLRWPHTTPVELRVHIGDRLRMELVTKNLGTSPVVLSQALHTYFAVSDVRSAVLLGLENTHYIDKVDTGKRKHQTGPVTFAEETDRIYLDTEPECTLVDPGLRRRIQITKTGSRSTVVWNPWIQKSVKMDDFVEGGYLGMVCVEAANAGDDLVTLLPGADHCLGVVYRIESLG